MGRGMDGQGRRNDACCLALIAAHHPRLRQPPCPHRCRLPAASSNATKKSFSIQLQKPDSKQQPADHGSGGGSKGGGLKGRQFAFLGMPADEDWIL